MKSAIIISLTLALLGCGDAPSRPVVQYHALSMPMWEVSLDLEGVDAVSAPTLAQVASELDRIAACAIDEARATGVRPAALPAPGEHTPVKIVLTGGCHAEAAPSLIGRYGMKLAVGDCDAREDAPSGTEPRHVTLREIGRVFAATIQSGSCAR